MALQKEQGPSHAALHSQNVHLKHELNYKLIDRHKLFNHKEVYKFKFDLQPSSLLFRLLVNTSHTENIHKL